MSKRSTSKVFGTDIERLHNMTDDQIDFSDIPRTTPEMWAKGVVRKGFKIVPKKKQLTLRLDEEIIEFFKNDGDGYQTRINALLRTYVDAHKAA